MTARFHPWPLHNHQFNHVFRGLKATKQSLFTLVLLQAVGETSTGGVES
jgi:hypothetical protein